MASNTIASTNVKVAADIAELKAGLNKANEAIANFGKKASKNLDSVKKSAERQSKSFLQMRRNIDTAVRGVAGSFVIREMVQYSKAIAKTSVDFKLLNQRIEVFTKNTSGFGEAFEAAQALGVAVENVAMGMGRIVAVGAEMGVTTKEARAMTTTFQQLALLSGSSIKESQAAFIQFTQALSSGRLSGEELRSVREQAPLVAQAITKYMGISIGEIKKVAEQGKITAEVMRGAMAAAAEDAAAKFAQLPVSLERQQAAFENAWGRVLAAMDVRLKQSTLWQFFYKFGTEQFNKNAITTIPAFMLTNDELKAQLKELSNKRLEANASIKEAITQQQVTPGLGPAAPIISDIKFTLEDQQRLFELFSESAKRAAADAADVRAAAEGARKATAEEILAESKYMLALSKARYAATMQEFELGERWLEQQGEMLELQRKMTKVGPYIAIGGKFPTEDGGEITPERVGGYEQTMREFEKGSAWLEDQKEQVGELNQFVVQAARDMQSAFADFLFDPFSEGLKGMFKGFVDTIRKMVAQIVAQQVLTAFFGGMSQMGGVLGEIGGTLLSGLKGKASGGPVSSSKAYIVGEKGPELLVGASGRIIPNGGMGGMTVAPVYNIDARGASQDLAKQLPSILAAHARQTVEMARRAINDDVSRNAFGRA